MDMLTHKKKDTINRYMLRRYNSALKYNTFLKKPSFNLKTFKF